ncbi:MULTISPECIES: hypothetical protein [unclassified Pseudomonas]|uniref:hypothetical protein n=1 Tax=unclassified Pseudomonas TaxID=196821 RepID=UPI000A1E7A00|nr:MULTISPECIES: hypothetical protein [unclassified Pseudomonas]MDI2144765.1 hypothetical protein [Pseudomonas sp. ITA]
MSTPEKHCESLEPLNVTLFGPALAALAKYRNAARVYGGTTGAPQTLEQAARRKAYDEAAHEIAGYVEALAALANFESTKTPRAYK